MRLQRPKVQDVQKEFARLRQAAGDAGVPTDRWELTRYEEDGNPGSTGWSIHVRIERGDEMPFGYTNGIELGKTMNEAMSSLSGMVHAFKLVTKHRPVQWVQPDSPKEPT